MSSKHEIAGFTGTNPLISKFAIWGKELNLSVTMFMVVTMITSTLACGLSNSWVLIWVFLELNTLSFCSLAKNSEKNNSAESSNEVMKYFIIQALASAVLLMAMIPINMQEVPNEVLLTLGALALGMKMAASPFHQWFIQVSKNLKWTLNTALFTWQKIAPLILTIFQAKALTLVMMVLSSVTGSMLMFNKKILKEIMAYSSVFNLGWMILAVCLSTKTLVVFSLLYWTSVGFAIYLFYNSKAESLECLKESESKWIPTLVMFNLAGIPPMVGFISKWTVVVEGLSSKAVWLVSLMLTISAANLFIYLRTMVPFTVKNTPQTLKSYTKMSSFVVKVFLGANALAMFNVML